jgi:hypothetical protein
MIGLLLREGAQSPGRTTPLSFGRALLRVEVQLNKPETSPAPALRFPFAFYPRDVVADFISAL